MHSRCSQTDLKAWPFGEGQKANPFLGIWPANTGNQFSQNPFQTVALALWGNVVGKIPVTSKLTISANTSYIPNFLRDYMREAKKIGKAYTPKDLESYWIPQFVSFGYNADILKVLFPEFHKLNNKGGVPRQIWNPARYGEYIPPAKNHSPGTTIPNQPSTFSSLKPYLPIAAGGALALILLMRK